VKDNGKDGLGASESGPGVRHVLKLSVMDTHYTVGTYNDVTDAFVAAEPEREDDYWNDSEASENE
jgi:hypothetical protein